MDCCYFISQLLISHSSLTDFKFIFLFKEINNEYEKIVLYLYINYLSIYNV